MTPFVGHTVKIIRPLTTPWLKSPISSEWEGLPTSKFVYGWRTMAHITPLWPQKSRSPSRLTPWPKVGHIFRKGRPTNSKSKVGIQISTMNHITDICGELKRSKIKVVTSRRQFYLFSHNSTKKSCRNAKIGRKVVHATVESSKVKRSMSPIYLWNGKACKQRCSKALRGPWFNSNLGALPFPPSTSPHPFPPLPSPAPPLPRSGPQIQLGGLGERCKLPQRPSRNRIWCILALISAVWWQQF